MKIEGVIFVDGVKLFWEPGPIFCKFFWGGNLDQSLMCNILPLSCVAMLVDFEKFDHILH